MRHPAHRERALALALSLLLVACRGDADPRALRSPLLTERFAAARLASTARWRACTVADTAALVPRSRCAPPPAPDDARVAELTRLARPSRPSTAPDTALAALHLGALIDLRWQDATPAGIDRAVAALERARGRAPADARVLNDLAVAYLARSERDQQLRSLLQAVDAIEEARARDDALPAILFNRALILERAYLVRSAQSAWARYLAVERDPEWRREGAARLERLRAGSDPGFRAADAPALLARPGAPVPPELVAGARRSPHAARELALALLGEWGAARRNGDTARAAHALVLARALALPGGDASVALALAPVAAHAADARRTDALARAHAELSRGLALYNRAAYDDAARALGDAAARLRALGAPAARWATLFHAGAELNRGEHAAAESLLRRALAEATPEEPAVRGKALWGLGLGAVRRGSYEAGTGYYREAATYLARAGETENLAVVSSLLAEGLNLAGQSAVGRVEALRALRLLAPYRRSSFLGNHLNVFASYARADRLPRAARAVMDEIIVVAHQLGRPQVVAWAHGDRARDLGAVGERDAAWADVAEALRWVERIPPGRGRDRIRADVLLVRGELLRATDPRAARDELARVADAYRALRSDIDVPNALYQAALAARAAGDSAAERARLAEAAGVIESRRAWFTTTEVRATYFETVERVFDALIARALNDGRAADAFDHLERARLAAWDPSAAAGGARPAIADVPARLARDELLVAYAVLADRVAVWTVSAGGWRAHAIPLPRDSVAALVERFDAEAVDARTTGESARARLFDLLLRPLAAELAGVRRLGVVPDRELARVPFAALWDRERGRYAVETYTIRTLPSAAFLAAPPARSAARRPSRPLVVGDPSLDTATAPGLARLPGAGAEAAGVAALYPGARLLTGAGARREAVLALLPRHDVFHFAGHAVADDERPELSRLVLAAGGGGTDGSLRARDIGRLRLPDVRLAILSACSTLGARPTHVGPVAGLAYSFLRAGVPATVSSLWAVSDATTAAVLVAFHRGLAAGMPAAEALRAAQVEALRAEDAGPRAPYSWAAFVYTGP